MKLLRDRLPAWLPLMGVDLGDTNVVPVDYVAKAIDHLAHADGRDRETFHLVDPEPITSGEVFELLSELYANKKPSYTLPARPVALALRSKKVRELFQGIPAESIQYLNHPVRYDARRAADLLERNGLRLPRFPEYAETMVKFFREHEDDPAFAPAL
jgi:hypothetical protein